MTKLGRTVLLAGFAAVAAAPSSAMVEYTQMATEAAEAAGCSVAAINESGQTDDGALVYDVECEGAGNSRVTCTPDGCTYGGAAGGSATTSPTSARKTN